MLVPVDPPVITKQPGAVVSLESEEAKFHCEAEGFPTPKIRWLKLDSTLPRSRATMSLNDTLTIRNIHRHDAGTYVCLAENIFGVVRSYASLIVQGQSFREIVLELINDKRNSLLLCNSSCQVCRCPAVCSYCRARKTCQTRVCSYRLSFSNYHVVTS